MSELFEEVRGMEKTTKQMHEELADREGTQEMIIGAHEKLILKTDQQTVEFTGPARVLINQD